jgi:hypothetical protein
MHAGRQRHYLGRPIERNGVTDVVDDDPARVAVCQMLLERLAECGLRFAIDIVVQCIEQFLALHGLAPLFNEHCLELLLARQPDNLIGHCAILEDL